ncbi:MAG: hypothetical protein ACRD5M_03585 [Candidatus Acidiferrales bacterium]
MRIIARSCLVAFLVGGLMNLPLLAANERPLGMVVQADEAQLGGAKATVGATVYPGDSIATSTGGTMRLKVGSGQLYLLSSSAATLAENTSAFHAVINRGTVGFSTSATEPFELETPLGIVRPAAGPAYGQVTLTGPREMIVSAYRGDLIVDNNGVLHTIPEGKSFRVTADLDPAPPPNAAAAQGPYGTGVKPAVNPHFILKLTAVAALGVATYFIYQELSESPSKP